jgi:hypothetical protein
VKPGVAVVGKRTNSNSRNAGVAGGRGLFSKNAKGLVFVAEQPAGAGGCTIYGAVPHSNPVTSSPGPLPSSAASSRGIAWRRKFRAWPPSARPWLPPGFPFFP